MRYAVFRAGLAGSASERERIERAVAACVTHVAGPTQGLVIVPAFDRLTTAVINNDRERVKAMSDDHPACRKPLDFEFEAGFGLMVPRSMEPLRFEAQARPS